LSGSLAFFVLDKYRERTARDAAAGVPSEKRDPDVPEYVDELFTRIDADPPKDKDPLKDIAPLELYYLLVLPQISRPARYVSQAFGEYPDTFVEMILMLDQRKAAGQNVDAVLRAWKGHPGEGLPDAEREAKLEAWAAEVLKKTREERHDHTGS